MHQSRLLKLPGLYWLLALSFIILTPSANAKDPLPSWQDGPTKSAITQFVISVTKTQSPNFVPQAERIAVFDNDGTLWSEFPVYFQVFFIVDRIKQLAPQHPEWKTTEPFASVLKGDLEGAVAGGMDSLMALMGATHAGMSPEEFNTLVANWIATAKHPKTGRRFHEMVYQPMLELLAYLRNSGFKTYIVSGGGVAFMRAWAEPVYGVPIEQIIGSRIKSEFKIIDGKASLLRLPEISYIDDKEGKPIAIYDIIGRRPLMAFGNSDGDLAMLQWTMAGKGSRFAAIVHHTDAKREAAYDRNAHVGQLDKALDEAKAKDWTLINMERDWKTVYPPLP